MSCVVLLESGEVISFLQGSPPQLGDVLWYEVENKLVVVTSVVRPLMLSPAAIPVAHPSRAIRVFVEELVEIDGVQRLSNTLKDLSKQGL